MKNPEKKRTESRRETGQTRCRWMKRWKGREKKKPSKVPAENQ